MNDIDRLQRRIEELERRVRDLEARPAQQPVVIPPPQYAPVNPWNPPTGPFWYGGKPMLTCEAPNVPTPYKTYVIGSDGSVRPQ